MQGKQLPPTQTWLVGMQTFLLFYGNQSVKKLYFSFYDFLSCRISLKLPLGKWLLTCWRQCCWRVVARPARCGVTIVWDNAYCQWDIVLICVLANRIKPTVMAGKVITGFQRATRCEDAPQSIWMGKFWNETQIEWATGARYNICDLSFRPLLRLGWSKTSSSAHLSHQNI